MHPDAFWESMTDFNYQLRFKLNESLKEFETKIVEKYPYDSDTDDESGDSIDENDVEAKDLISKQIRPIFAHFWFFFCTVTPNFPSIF